MYLTKLTLDPTAHRPQQLLGNTQSLHAAIAASFPTNGGRVLWRIEPASGGDIVVLVASPEGPTEPELWERITTPDRAQTRPYSSFLDSIKQGDRYRFRATLNPVKTRNGRQTPIFDETAQTEWAASRLAAHGANVATQSADLDHQQPDMRIVSTVRDQFTRRGHTGTVELLKVTIDGTVAVTDTAAITNVLRNGLGRAKGYGCGLLTLAPL
jgi:CRISPR system Cascade subunit CasE